MSYIYIYIYICYWFTKALRLLPLLVVRRVSGFRVRVNDSECMSS